ncbi:MAG: alpha/beta hydrolase, partial [Myxococcota bacterium]
HLIGHSLGNIIIRNSFREDHPGKLGHVVMLAPPNHPAKLAKMLADNPLYRWRTGDSGQKLGSEEFYSKLPVPDVPFGVIAGNKGQQLTFDEPNDGVVTVANTKLDGMADWIALPKMHTFIMNGDDTLNHVVSFLKRGQFKR